MQALKLIGKLIVIVAVFFAGYLYNKIPKRELTYELKTPLRLETNDKTKDYYLPAGTLLYYHWQPGEGGFATYRVYIDLYGPAPELKLTDKRGLIAPLTAFIEEDTHNK